MMPAVVPMPFGAKPSETGWYVARARGVAEAEVVHFDAQGADYRVRHGQGSDPFKNYVFLARVHPEGIESATLASHLDGRSDAVGIPPALASLRWVYEGWTRFGIAHICLGDGLPIKREIEDHGDCATVLPYDPERRVALLVAQPRIGPILKGVAEPILEAPAGGLDGDGPEAAVRREALEEAGVRLGPLELVVRGWSMLSVSTERPWHYLAPYTAADRVAAGGGLADEGEALSVHEIPLAEIAALAADGRLTDVKTLLLVLALQVRRPDLFV